MMRNFPLNCYRWQNGIGIVCRVCSVSEWASLIMGCRECSALCGTWVSASVRWHRYLSGGWLWAGDGLCERDVSSQDDEWIRDSIPFFWRCMGWMIRRYNVFAKEAEVCFAFPWRGHGEFVLPTICVSIFPFNLMHILITTSFMRSLLCGSWWIITFLRGRLILFQWFEMFEW